MAKFEFGEYEDGEPFVMFYGDNKPIIANYENSALYTHGFAPEIDHFFVELEESARTLGAFVWRHACDDFDELANALIERDFVHIHRPYPSDGDVEAYEACIKKAEDKIDEQVKQETEHLDEELRDLLS